MYQTHFNCHRCHNQPSETSGSHNSLSDNGTPRFLPPPIVTLPCTHLRRCRFRSAGSARNPPADSAGTNPYWSSSSPQRFTVPIGHRGQSPDAVTKTLFLRKTYGVRKSQPDSTVAPTWLPMRTAHAQWTS